MRGGAEFSFPPRRFLRSRPKIFNEKIFCHKSKFYTVTISRGSTSERNAVQRRNSRTIQRNNKRKKSERITVKNAVAFSVALFATFPCDKKKGKSKVNA